MNFSNKSNKQNNIYTNANPVRITSNQFYSKNFFENEFTLRLCRDSQKSTFSKTTKQQSPNIDQQSQYLFSRNTKLTSSLKKKNHTNNSEKILQTVQSTKLLDQPVTQNKKYSFFDYVNVKSYEKQCLKHLFNIDVDEVNNENANEKIRGAYNKDDNYFSKDLYEKLDYNKQKNQFKQYLIDQQNINQIINDTKRKELIQKQVKNNMCKFIQNNNSVQNQDNIQQGYKLFGQQYL